MNRIGTGLGIEALLGALNDDQGADRYRIEVVFDPMPTYTLYHGLSHRKVGTLEGEYDPSFMPCVLNVDPDVPWRLLDPLRSYLELR